MDQTIIIGDVLEETQTSIFDDLKVSHQGTKETVTISKDDLQEMVDNLKIRHRAEIDAIMIELCTYKRIIQQMVGKLKSQQRKMELQHF